MYRQIMTGKSLFEGGRTEKEYPCHAERCYAVVTKQLIFKGKPTADVNELSMRLMKKC